MVPSALHGRDTRLASVMIEVRRDLYLDEVTGERLAAYGAVRSALERSVIGSGVVA